MTEPGRYAAEVALSYAGSLVLLAAIIALTLIQSRRAKVELDKIERRDG